jgi:hypothetical protein
MQFIVAGLEAATLYIPLILANIGAVYINFLLAAEQNYQRTAKYSVRVLPSYMYILRTAIPFVSPSYRVLNSRFI